MQLLSSLPYPPMALAPSLLATVRSGFEADFATLGWCEGEACEPTAFYAERMSAPVLRWVAQNPQALFEVLPLQAQKESGGEAVRAVALGDHYTQSLAYRHAFEPLGARWSMSVPLWSRAGQCVGFVYLHRLRAPFTDAEQARLQRVSERLRIEHSPLPARARAEPLPRYAVRTALLRIGAQGRIQARSAQAFELLFMAQGRRWGSVDWDADTLAALPEAVADAVQRLLRGQIAQWPDDCRLLELPCGAMAFSAERLEGDAGHTHEVVLTISLMEPADLAVARRLLHWPLSPREKQVLVASTRHPSHKRLAEALGCTVGTLKGTIHSLQHKLGGVSREAFLAELLCQG